MINLFLELEGPSLERHMKVFFCGYRPLLSPIELLYLFIELYCKVEEGYSQGDTWNKIISQITFWCTHYVKDFVGEVKDELINFMDNIVSKTIGEKVANCVKECFLLSFEKNTKSLLSHSETRKSLEPNRILSRFSGNTLLNGEEKRMEDSELVLFVASEISSTSSSKSTCNEKFNLLDLKPEVFTEQLVLIEFELWKCLEVREFSNVCWTKKDKALFAPNITSLISHFNHISSWVVTQILSYQDPKDRKNAIEFVITMASHARKLHSFNTLFELMSALNKSSILRLKASWSEVSSKLLSKYQEYDELMNPSCSYKNLREAISKSKYDYFSQKKSSQINDPKFPGYLPYLGLYLQDLFFIEEGNQNKREDGLYNYGKLELIYRVISNVIDAKSSCYEKILESVPSTKTCLLNCKVLDEDESMEISYKYEKKK
eukprot:TRINITY_DN13717_c0_g1_i1.p1 TRINITY_DN13717_c0_g1~~TRINITY_DN13717_c0_g1_i1.p1  ORF type:complete len:432 (+),score=137.25 TRINITY_DN13717_c0_g1_i1:641-1936(+)